MLILKITVNSSRRKINIFSTFYFGSKPKCKILCSFICIHGMSSTKDWVQSLSCNAFQMGTVHRSRLNVWSHSVRLWIFLCKHVPGNALIYTCSVYRLDLLEASYSKHIITSLVSEITYQNIFSTTYRGHNFILVVVSRKM